MTRYDTNSRRATQSHILLDLWKVPTQICRLSLINDLFFPPSLHYCDTLENTLETKHTFQGLTVCLFAGPDVCGTAVQ